MTEIGRTDDITVGPCFGTDESCKARFDGKEYLVSHDEVEVLQQFYKLPAPRLRMYL